MQSLARQDVILQLAEQDRLKSKPPYAAFLYDDEMPEGQRNVIPPLTSSPRRAVHQQLASVLQQAGVDGLSRVPQDQAALSQQLASPELPREELNRWRKGWQRRDANCWTSLLTPASPNPPASRLRHRSGGTRSKTVLSSRKPRSRTSDRISAAQCCFLVLRRGVKSVNRSRRHVSLKGMLRNWCLLGLVLLKVSRHCNMSNLR